MINAKSKHCHLNANGDFLMSSTSNLNTCFIHNFTLRMNAPQLQGIKLRCIHYGFCGEGGLQFFFLKLSKACNVFRSGLKRKKSVA